MTFLHSQINNLNICHFCKIRKEVVYILCSLFIILAASLLWVIASWCWSSHRVFPELRVLCHNLDWKVASYKIFVLLHIQHVFFFENFHLKYIFLTKKIFKKNLLCRYHWYLWKKLFLKNITRDIRFAKNERLF